MFSYSQNHNVKKKIPSNVIGVVVLDSSPIFLWNQVLRNSLSAESEEICRCLQIFLNLETPFGVSYIFEFISQECCQWFDEQSNPKFIYGDVAV